MHFFQVTYPFRYRYPCYAKQRSYVVGFDAAGGEYHKDKDRHAANLLFLRFEEVPQEMHNVYEMFLHTFSFPFHAPLTPALSL